MTHPESPFRQADQKRKEIAQALETEKPFSAIIDNSIFACLSGLSKDILEKTGLSELIKPTRKGTYLLIAESQEIALTAFRFWQEESDPKSKIHFNKAQYLALYQLIQAVHHQQGKEIVKGLPGIFLTLLEEQDEILTGLSALIKKKGAIPEEDLVRLQTHLYQIWDCLPKAVKNSIASFAPENLLKS